MLIVTTINPGGIFLIDESSLSVRRIHDEPHRGIDRDGQDFYVLNNRGPRHYRLVDETLVEINRVEMEADWHGLKIRGNRVFAAVAETDKLIVYDRTLERIDEYDMRRGTEGRNHTNDFFFDGDSIIFSAFAETSCARYKHGPGCIGKYRNGSFETIHPATQPHSVCKHDGRIYWCDSERYLVCCDGEPVVKTDSYTRGLLVTPTDYWIGLSRQRHKKHHTDRSAVLRVPRNGGERAEISLPIQEVYQIMRAS